MPPRLCAGRRCTAAGQDGWRLCPGSDRIAKERAETAAERNFVAAERLTRVRRRPSAADAKAGGSIRSRPSAAGNSIRSGSEPTLALILSQADTGCVRAPHGLIDEQTAHIAPCSVDSGQHSGQRLSFVHLGSFSTDRPLITPAEASPTITDAFVGRWSGVPNFTRGSCCARSSSAMVPRPPAEPASATRSSAQRRSSAHPAPIPAPTAALTEAARMSTADKPSSAGRRATERRWMTTTESDLVCNPALVQQHSSDRLQGAPEQQQTAEHGNERTTRVEWVGALECRAALSLIVFSLNSRCL